MLEARMIAENGQDEMLYISFKELFVAGKEQARRRYL